jgi:zinc protease
MKFIMFLIMAVFTVSVYPQQPVELKLPNSNKIVVKLRFTNGSMSDPKGKEGLTYLTATTLTSTGTKELTFSEIQDFLFPMAASYSAFVDKEVTTFTFSVHTDWLEKFYPVMTGLILNPAFAEEDFSRVKSNQQNYVDQVIRASSDEDYSKMVLEDLLFRGTPYQHMVPGKSASVASLTLQDVKEHYSKFFTKDNLSIGISGNYPNNLLSRLQKDLEALPSGKPKLPEAPKVQMPEGIHVEIVAKDNAFGSAVFTGYPINITRRDNDFAALMVANSYLGEHRKSYGKLYQQIRETRSMNYGNYSYIEWYPGGGGNMLPPSGAPRHSNYFSLWIRPVQIAKQLQMQYEELQDIKVGHAHFALRMALREVDKLVKDGMTQQDFESTRTFLRSYIKLYPRNLDQQLGYLLDSRFYDRKNYIEEMDKLLAALTLEDVNSAIKKHFQTDNMYVAIVTDRSEAEPLAESLKNNTLSPMSYSNSVKAGLPEDVLKEDDEAASFRLNVKSVNIVDSKDTFK